MTDTGEFDWEDYPNISSAYRKGSPTLWGIQQIRKKGLRDMGASLSSDQAHRLALGAETLTLRVMQASATALALARFLHGHAAVRAVHYPGLAGHPQHDIALRLFRSGSWLLSFELNNPDDIIPILNRLRIAGRATGMGDARTLVIPVAPTIYWEVGPEIRARMNIADELVRVSVGLEDTDELIADFSEALRLPRLPSSN